MFRARPQAFLAPLALGDVAADAHESDDRPAAVLERHFRGQDGSRVALRIEVGFIFIDQGLPGTHEFLLVAKILGRHFLRVEIDIALAHKIAGRGHPHDPCRGEIGHHEAALRCP